MLIVISGCTLMNDMTDRSSHIPPLKPPTGTANSMRDPCAATSLDKVKAAAFLATDRVHVLRQAIMCCRKAGTVSIPGVYVGMGDKIPLGAAMNKGLTFKTGQTHVQAYTKPLLKKIIEGKIDPSFVVTHPASLEDAPEMYKKFRDKKDGAIKVVMRPGQ